MRFRPGHHMSGRRIAKVEPPNPGGRCLCGCGREAPIAKQTSTRAGLVAGEHVRYITGHATRKRPLADDAPRLCACGCGGLTLVYRGTARRFLLGHNVSIRRISRSDYSVEDRGYETPCWIWKHSTTSDGRGRVTINGKTTTAYRAMFEQEVRSLLPAEVLDHLCEIPACICPNHLDVLESQAAHVRAHSVRRRH